MTTPNTAPFRPPAKPPYHGLFLEPALPPYTGPADEDETADEDAP